MIPKRTTANTKLWEMQYKIIHKIYATDSYVSNFDKTVNKECQHCAKKNNILHWFYECKLLETFLKNWKQWFKKLVPTSSLIDYNTVVFGSPNQHSFILNYCLLHTKWYIHKVHQQKTNNVLYFSLDIFSTKIKTWCKS